MEKQCHSLLNYTDPKMILDVAIGTEISLSIWLKISENRWMRLLELIYPEQMMQYANENE